MIDIELTDLPLDAERCLSATSSNAAGGAVLFVGTVRDNTAGRAVVRLEFEAYEPMAIAEMRKIAKEALSRWNCLLISIHHRTGVLFPGDIAVVIAVATPHRQAAFEACQYCIDTLKQTVPIWKKEFFSDGAVWVAAHP
jgi:molybdopterin synthase catalytic subunit